jgi:hypothetical protein
LTESSGVWAYTPYTELSPACFNDFWQD